MYVSLFSLFCILNWIVYCLFLLFLSFSDPYSDPRTRRRFFEKLAREWGFDPLVPSNWYSQSHDSILALQVFFLLLLLLLYYYTYSLFFYFNFHYLKDARKVISYHDHSLKKALINLFPTIGLESSKFNWFKGNTLLLQ